MKRKFGYIIVLLLVLGGMAAYFVSREPSSKAQPSSAPPVGPVAAAFNKQQYSLEDPNSIWVIINKTRKLPDNYKPDDLVVPDTALRLAKTAEQMQLRTEPAKQLEKLIAAAKQDSVNLALGSGFRSQALQKTFYDSYVNRDGKAAADTYSARPGYSEHQTGLAVDMSRVDLKCDLELCFADTPEGKWLVSHAHEYGFVIRYQQAKTASTGYKFEPWHLRYVGTELANEIHQSGKTLEEYFNLPAAPDYL